MPNIFYHKEFEPLIALMRLNAPTGYLLSFFPAAYGLILASQTILDLFYLPLFFIGSVLTRAAGCIINDIFDKDFDRKVTRTKNRPLASGTISVKTAIVILLVLLLCCLAILLLLTNTSIIVGFVAFFLIILYPLMKRITYFPQAFLGVTFNAGALIGFAAIQDAISKNAVILYIACGFWTMAYDTIYAFMDIKDDKKIGIKSTAIFFEHMQYKQIILTFYGVFTLLHLLVFYQFGLKVFIVDTLCFLCCIWICATLNIQDRANCYYRFKANNYIGLLLMLPLVLEKL